MKYNFTLLLLLLTFSFISCKKDKPSALPLIGTWELRHQNIAGVGKDYSSGNGNLLKFSSRNRFERHDSLDYLEGLEINTFRLSSEKSNNQRVDLILFGNSDVWQVYNIKNDTLSLANYPLISSGTTNIYVKISE